ncbi:MAG: pyrroline-5-carboxylate reductase family protein [Promethearchaeota archaeon]|jgi:pyrroline-5-carboxylate reductase
MAGKELGIIGLGKIGSTLLRVFLNSQTIDRENIIVYDIDKDVLTKNITEFNVPFAKDNKSLVQESKFVLLAVLPQVIDSVLNEISSVITKDHIIISIAAGISINHVSNIIQKDAKIIRIMTNTPALVKAAATAIAVNNNITKSELEYVKKLFDTLGLVVELEERHLDAVTGLSGSGPAYLFIIMESLAISIRDGKTPR